MAIIRAAQSGNFNTPATWIGGVVPTSVDDAVANTFTITMNVNAALLTLRNDTSGGATIGGFFDMSVAGVTINVGTITTHTVACVRINNTTGSVVLNSTTDIVGRNSINCILMTSVGDATISAPNVTSIVSNVGGIFKQSGIGTLNFIGNPVGGILSANTFGILINTGTLVVTGSPLGGTNTGANGIQQAGGTVTVNGNPLSSTNAIAINTTVGNLTVNGNYGSGAGVVSAINFTSTGTLILNGVGTASSTAPAVTVTLVAATVQVSGPLVDVNGVSAIFAPKWFLTNSSTNWTKQSAVGVNNILYTNNQVTGFPATSNVRSGIVYGVSGGLTGTLAVPNPSTVLSGVATDATTGTLLMTPQQFWEALTSAVSLSGSFGKLLKDTLDATVSSRLASASYTAPTTPPTVSAIRAEMDSNSTKLALLDVAVSTRNSVTPPTAIAIRTEIDSNSTKLDATISSRSSQTSVDGKPTLIQIEASTIIAKETTVASKASQTSVSAIPTNPLLTTDTRLNNLDAPISEITVDNTGVLEAIGNCPGNVITELSVSSEPIAERLRNVATVETTGAQIAASNI